MHKDDFTWHHIISVIKSIEVGLAVRDSFRDDSF